MSALRIHQEWRLTTGGPMRYTDLLALLALRATCTGYRIDLEDALHAFARGHELHLPVEMPLWKKAARCRTHYGTVQVVHALAQAGTVAGSFALHAYLQTRTARELDWYPGDADVYLPAKVPTPEAAYAALGGHEDSCDTIVHGYYDWEDSEDSSYTSVHGTVPELVPLPCVQAYIAASPKWRSYDWDTLLRPLRTSARGDVPYEIQEVCENDVEFHTVAGTRTHAVNLVFTDLAAPSADIIMGAFDIACCAISCHVTPAGALAFTADDVTMQAIRDGKLVLQPNAFRHTRGGMELSLFTQLCRVEKYMSRGFVVPR